MAGGKLHGLPRFLMSYEISVLHPIGEWFGSRPNLDSLRIIGENPQLLGVCFLREVFETAIGSDQPACRLVRRSLGVGGSLGKGGGEDWRAGKWGLVAVSSVLEFFLEFLSRSLHQRHNQPIVSDLGDFFLTMAEGVGLPSAMPICAARKECFAREARPCVRTRSFAGVLVPA